MTTAVDWSLVVSIAMPVITLFLGIWINHVFESRPKLISHLGFIASHEVEPTPPNTTPMIVNTHSVVVRNAGRKAATNVRLGHNFLPNVKVFPDVDYEVRDLPGGGKEIIFPTLVPKKSVTVSYLYYPPYTWERINTHIESDAGPAKVVPVVLQQQAKPWQLKLFWGLAIIGVVSCLYMLFELYRWAAI